MSGSSTVPGRFQQDFRKVPAGFQDCSGFFGACIFVSPLPGPRDLGICFVAGFMFWLGHRCLSSHALKISYHRPTQSATHRQARRSRNHHRNGQSSRSGSRAPQVNDGLAVPARISLGISWYIHPHVNLHPPIIQLKKITLLRVIPAMTFIHFLTGKS